MNDLFMFAAHNTVVALLFALFVHGLTRVWRNPPVAHLLWLLVLLKLVAPLVVRLDATAVQLTGSPLARGQMIADVLRTEAQKAESHPRFADRPTSQTTAQALATNVKEPDVTASLWLIWNRVQPVLFWFWLGGTALCALVAATRIVRFERLLRDTLPASERLQRLALEIARKIGVRRTPDVRYVDCAEVPLLWCAGGRPTIVLPTWLMRQLDDQQVAMIMAHELAHLRRRDHWVRPVELIVSTVYWWNPLVWAIRRQIHHAEDLCCDAWVRCAFPDCAKRYAEVVFKTAESLSASPNGARLLPASPFLHSLSLKARIEMILESRFAPSVSTRSMFVVALLAILVLPAFVQTTKTGAWASASDEAPATPARKPGTPAASEFQYAVRFEQGVTRFSNGDEITIREVRGTADTLTPGNIYCIRGTYALASHERAMLAAYTTASDAADGTGASLNVQTATVDRGHGAFTLFLPMSCKGWPHVSFYPAEGGESFGGNYFGTGDSVLKRWWGTAGTQATKGSDDEAAATLARKQDTPSTSDLPFAVQFDQGATQFLNGDKITIVEVRGTADTLTPGNIYCIRGTYSLASHERAILAAFTTASDAAHGTGASLNAQTVTVDRGEGAFTLFLPMSCKGWPHVSFYPAEGGEGFGGNYFGTSDSVLKRWWGSKGTD